MTLGFQFFGMANICNAFNMYTIIIKERKNRRWAVGWRRNIWTDCYRTKVFILYKKYFYYFVFSSKRIDNRDQSETDSNGAEKSSTNSDASKRTEDELSAPDKTINESESRYLFRSKIFILIFYLVQHDLTTKIRAKQIQLVATKTQPNQTPNKRKRFSKKLTKLIVVWSIQPVQKK